MSLFPVPYREIEETGESLEAYRLASLHMWKGREKYETLSPCLKAEDED